MQADADELYDRLGITFTAIVETDYGPNLAEEITICRCRECGALVDEGTWLSGMDTHTEWHAKLAMPDPARK